MKNVKYKEFLLGAVLSTAVFYPWASLLEVDPYTDVDVVSAVSTEDGVLITANFHKNECTFKRLEVHGTDFGETYNLEWGNQPTPHETDRGTNYDRTEGSQTLRLLVETNGQVFDSLEIRTRHDCDGTTIDKVFATIGLTEQDNTND